MQVPPVIVVVLYANYKAAVHYILLFKMSIYYSCNFCRITFDLISDIKNNFALKVSFYVSIFRLNIIGNTKHSFSQKALIFGTLSINEILSEPVDNLTLVSHFPEMLLISVALLA